ncbi:phage baseplate assembly protein V [Sporomusa sphaeroides]|uniref:Phage-related baseplate assembly protein n=1 Tax=Sporomusa sphaeroides DSM 2875 TaxID=1337886 RepID=A0ABM9W0T0_9FIRM|nr:phage baseplate assembly protein V [Sporomusa sphaeroides]MCM0759614.1 phage baseplate assembly protein V [Sporomusa sphaeroides DSM 2875]OLS56361.1 phage-related baseplate assembly protein [Sporomusa sphaeroides DSM 2875]CVK18456.1 Phage-related baseplate assembly protein [Sporomusa sphaeroides DSM 2875]
MDPVLKNLVRVGRVSSRGKATVKVVFGDRQNMVSYDLSVLVQQSQENKDWWMPDIGEQVVCLFLPSGNAQGFVLGSFYSDVDEPPVDDMEKRHISFKDGTVLEYDIGTHTLMISAQGPVNIVAAGNVNVTGDVIADGVSLKTHVHGGVEPGGGTTGQPA